MGAEADYTIKARIVAEDATGPGTRDATRNVERVITTTNSLGSSMSRLFGLMGGAYGLGRMGQGFVGVNTEIQDATNGLATLYNAMTGTDMGRAFRVAQQDVAALRKDAREGIGELTDYLQGYQRILGPGMSAGASTETLRELNRNAIAAAGALGRPLEQAGFDVVQALTSGAHDRTTPIVEAALAAIGMTDAAFNRLPVAQRIEELNRAFGAFGPGVELMGRSWTAQTSTFVDHLKNAVRLVSAPLFERWSEQLRRANGWLERNQEQIESIATTWGARMVRMWDTLIQRAGTYAAIVAAGYAAPQVLGMMAPGGLAGRAQSAGGAIMAGLRDPLGMSAMLGAPNATPGIIAMVETGMASLARLAGPIAIVTTGILAIRGSMREFGGVTEYVVSAWGRLLGAFGALGLGFDSLTAKGSVLNILGAGLLGTFGGVIDVLGLLVRGLASLAVGLGLVLQVIGDGMKAIYYVSTGNLAAASQIDVMGRLDAANTALKDIWTFSDGAQPAAPEAVGTEKLNVKGNGNTIINGPVSLSIKAEINDDPNRTIIAVGKAFDKLRTSAVQARRIPSLSGA